MSGKTGQAATRMTQQYLVGELSSMLGELQDAATDLGAAREIAHLRHAAEAAPPVALGPALGYALELANQICGDALAVGTSTAFLRDIAICAELREWGVCAGFLPDL